MSSAPRPGWYPDPAGASELYRWWDGADWTEAISESPRAPTPRTHHPAEPADELVRRRPSRFRAVVALVVCIALFLSATVGLGLIIWRDPPAVKRSAPVPETGAAASSSPLSGRAGAVGRLDERSRRATLGSASMSLPGPPYLLSPDPLQVEGLMDTFFLASAPVHLRYDGTHSWSSAVLLGRLPADVAGPELAGQGQRTLERLSAALFRAGPTRLGRVRSVEHAVDGNRGLLLTAKVHYDIAKLPSRYDELTALLVRMDDGSVVAAVSSVPDDADPRVVALAAASLRSLEVR